MRRADEVSARSFAAPWARALDGALKLVLALALLGELGIVFCNILTRTLLGHAFTWTDEAAHMALSTIGFLGGAFAYRRGEHAFIHTLLDALPYRAELACYALVEYLVLAAAITTGVSAIPLLASQWEELTPVLEIRLGWFVLPLLIGLLVLMATAIERLMAQPRPTVASVGLGFGSLVLALVLTRDLWLPWLKGDAALALSLALFLVPLVLGLPVGFALLLGSLAYLYASGAAPMLAVAKTMVGGVNNFVYLAFPFFILAAIVMNRGGLSLRLVHLALACVGHLRGGLYQVMVVSMYLVSGLSGSKSADVAVVGSVMRDMLRREGYNLEQATAVLAASAAMGETVPPSIAMLVLGSITTLSIGALFIAGLIPAAVIGVCLMALIYVQARRSNAPRAPRASLRQLAWASLHGILPLLMPVILFGGILLGVATPTEVSSFAVGYGVVLAALVYRELGFRAFVRGLVDSAAVAGMIVFILATASSFAWTLTIAQFPHRLVKLLTGGHQSHAVFMLASILLLIVTGSMLDGLPALLILAPILLPIAAQVGASQLHYGIVLIIAMGIGLFIPPIGVGFYVTCAICETTIEESTRAMLPYFVVLCLGLLIVAMVPWFTLYLPVKLNLGV